MKFRSTVIGEYTTQDIDSSRSIYNTTVVSYQAPSSASNKSDYATGETLTQSKSDSGVLNRTFVILIKIFWVVDIFYSHISRYVYIYA